MERIPLPPQENTGDDNNKKEKDTEQIDKYFTQEFLDKILPVSQK
tara:strand:- start:470 stop:604 length:135 start_codon:yes stop_codon:yes gene_type:complete